MKAADAAAKIFRIKGPPPIDMEQEEQPMKTAEPEGYISADTYQNLMERFQILQLELANRDVTIARLNLEVMETKRDKLQHLLSHHSNKG